MQLFIRKCLDVKSLDDSGLLVKGFRETIKNEAEKQNGGFLGMLLGTLVASLLGNLLTGKDIITACEEVSRTCSKRNLKTDRK